jgi:hypothetical protein
MTENKLWNQIEKQSKALETLLEESRPHEYRYQTISVLRIIQSIPFMIRNFGYSKTSCEYSLRFWNSMSKATQNEIESLSSKEEELFKSIKTNLDQLLEYYTEKDLKIK